MKILSRSRKSGGNHKSRVYSFSWLYKDLKFLNKRAQKAVISRELKEIVAEERFLRRMLNKISYTKAGKK